MTRYLDLAEYLWLAEQVTGIEATTLAKASRIDLADSLLEAKAPGDTASPVSVSASVPASGAGR